MGFPTKVIYVDGQSGIVDVTKADVGLSNADNTSDVNKPVSTAQLAAIQTRSNAIISTTWEDRATAIAAIAASIPGNGLVNITNIGPNESLWWCDGTKLTRAHIIPLVSGGVPVYVPSSGSIANNGALTLTTALPLIYPNVYLYFPANAIAAGSAAGKYYCQMSSTTVGVIFNNTYVSGTPVVPTSPTAFVTTGPGAYTQTISTNITLIAANTATTSASQDLFYKFTNQGVENKQYVNNSFLLNGVSGTLPTINSIDTTANTALNAIGNIAVATDFVGIIQYIIEQIPSI